MPAQRLRQALSLAILPLLGLCAFGCRGQARGAPERPNLLLILVDTLRADHVGVFGSGRATSPHVDALARQATRFTRAYSAAPWTLPAVASLLTGLQPTTHTAISAQSRLPEQALTLAEMLKAAGYRTAGVVSHLFLKPIFGLGQGFDSYDDTQSLGHDAVTTPAVTDRAIARLTEMARDPAPFFLFVHYFDPHYNYKHHVEFGFAPAGVGRLNGSQSERELRMLAPSITPAEIEFIRALYDEEIAFTDAGIGRLLAALRETGRDEQTLIVFASDHGEEFVERSSIGHTRTLYDELLRVPLVIRPSGAKPTERVIDTPISLVSVTPTVLELLGFDVSHAGFEAPSLAASVKDGTEPPARRVFSEVDYPPVKAVDPTLEAYKKSVVDGHWKLIRDDRSRRLELFDLRADPGERRDLSGSEPDVVRELAASIEQHLAEARRNALGSEDSAITAEQKRLLQSLGYTAH